MEQIYYSCWMSKCFFKAKTSTSNFEKQAIYIRVNIELFRNSAKDLSQTF